jgi:hypothetical protein
MRFRVFDRLCRGARLVISPLRGPLSAVFLEVFFPISGEL